MYVVVIERGGWGSAWTRIVGPFADHAAAVTYLATWAARIATDGEMSGTIHPLTPTDTE